MSEYLSEAVKGLKEEEKQLIFLKKHVLEDQVEKALKRLKWIYQRNKNHDGLRKCIQYMENRPGQFAYAQAEKKDLPIGSGKIESTHRSLIQKRLKKPGAWWLHENARKMACLRVLRANGSWHLLWEEQSYRASQKEAA